MTRCTVLPVQPDAFPNVQCVKKKNPQKNPQKLISGNVLSFWSFNSVLTFLPTILRNHSLKDQLVIVTHSVPLLFQCASRSYTVVTLCLFLEYLQVFFTGFVQKKPTDIKASVAGMYLFNVLESNLYLEQYVLCILLPCPCTRIVGLSKGTSEVYSAAWAVFPVLYKNVSLPDYLLSIN